jgi:regulatory protein
MTNPLYTVTDALEKMKKYCAFQERSSYEVKLKLMQHAMRGTEAEFVIATLISEGYLNEERFARSFTRGKFRMNHWGKAKIEAELRGRGVSKQNILKSFEEISDDDYEETLRKVIKKTAGSKIPTDRKGRQSLIRKLMQKGFEADLVFRLLGEDQTED